MTKHIKAGAWGSALTLLIVGVLLGVFSTSTIHYAQAERQVIVDERAEKIAQELREEMISKIWHGESKSYVPENGELFVTYDPDKAMRDSGVCLKIGGKRPVDCDSYGPMQIKLGTLMDMWPKIHNGEKVTQLEALAITQDLEKAQQFFTDCAVKVEGCVWRWTSSHGHEAYFDQVIPIIRKLEAK